MINNYNYKDYDGNDCTNYVSQCAYTAEFQLQVLGNLKN
ncbi:MULTISPECIES: amidase domain-containing protein [unclassified Clostridium]